MRPLLTSVGSYLSLLRYPVTSKRINNVLLTQSQRRRYVSKKNEGTILEVQQGIGGSEAMLFADELFSLYIRYFDHMRWSYTVPECDRGEVGIRSVKSIVSCPYVRLIQEAGVHRVQRIPKTERHGRMHTSTATVAVTPKSILEFKIDDRDVEITSKRASGPGGQYVNKTESAIRLLHRPTGIAVESQESRNQVDNKKTAMIKLLDKIRSRELNRLTSEIGSMRKLQIGTSDRNEKIRTYNFPQDRLTDHRIGKSYHNLRDLMDGNVSILAKIIDDFHKLQ